MDSLFKTAVYRFQFILNCGHKLLLIRVFNITMIKYLFATLNIVR
jgi:hypothetical protein